MSLPLMREGVSPLRAFGGRLSGIVEPLGGVLGAAFVHYCRPMLPFTMVPRRGAMIFVVCDSLVPEMQARDASRTKRPPARQFLPASLRYRRTATRRWRCRA